LTVITSATARACIADLVCLQGLVASWAELHHRAVDREGLKDDLGPSIADLVVYKAEVRQRCVDPEGVSDSVRACLPDLVSIEDEPLQRGVDLDGIT
jgi:hypothetical protein